MEDREWMYTGHVGRNDVTPEWIKKTDAFMERAYGKAAKGVSLVPCPCIKCFNEKRKSKNIFGIMDLHRNILGGSSMVKRVIRERRW
jgi:hypothetical protein